MKKHLCVLQEPLAEPSAADEQPGFLSEATRAASLENSGMFVVIVNVVVLFIISTTITIIPPIGINRGS